MATTHGAPGGFIRRGQCTNFGNCSVADARTTVEVPTGQDFVCTECGKALLLTAGDSEGSRLKPGLIVAAVAVLLVVAGGLAWLALGGKKPADPAGTLASVPATPAPSKSAVAAPPVLRIAGSNTLGSKLVPALAEAWLKQEGATSIDRVAGKSPVESSLQGRFGDGAVKTITIAAHGSSTAFDGLANGSADIGMSSRRANPEEVDRLKALGALLGPASEHVVGLDGLAVIVHKSSQIGTIGKDQVAAIFAGQVTDWNQLGAAARGKTGPIALLARDDKSGTFDTFQHLVLGPARMAAAAKRFEDSAQLSDAVASDPSAIGFIGLPYVRNAKALSIAEKGAVGLLPNRFTVATEDYPLSRRLYLYTAAAPANPNVLKFVEFAKSKAGQDIVAQHGFVEQTVRAQDAQDAHAVLGLDQAPGEYRKLTANARRLSLNFRFRTASKDLDNKAGPDLERVVQFLSDMRTPANSIMLLGFADARGGAEMNLKLSRDRAQTVSDEFRQRGIQPGAVTGFGAALPIASNDTPEGQEKNRRVEIWVRR